MASKRVIIILILLHMHSKVVKVNLLLGNKERPVTIFSIEARPKKEVKWSSFYPRSSNFLPEGDPQGAASVASCNINVYYSHTVYTRCFPYFSMTTYFDHD